MSSALAPAQAAPRRSLRTRHPLAVFVGRRIGAGLVTVFVVSVLIFLALQVLPGSAADILLGRGASPQRIAEVERQLGTNDPVVTRYLDIFGGMVTGDLGLSTVGVIQGNTTSVGSVVGPAFGRSLALMLITVVLFVPMAVGLGLLSGLRAGSARDTAITSGSLAVSALPEFLIGTLLILVFFNALDVLPPISSIPDGDSAWAHPRLLVLPVATLLLVSVAFGSRQLRASVAEVVAQDYVLTARINGYPWRKIVVRYVLPNAVVPSIQILAQQVQYLIGGIIIVESVFNFPGVGTVLVRAISAQDTQMTVVVATILAAVYIAINVLADVAAALIDPKVRTSLA